MKSVRGNLTRILFIGDSITDCNRRSTNQPLGNGYVQLVADMLKIHHPEQLLDVVNRGIAGNTMEDLRSRWTDHALCEKPDWIVLKVGINDCNRYEVDPAANALQSPENYAKILDQIIELTRRHLPATRSLLVSPFYLSLDDDLPDSYRARIRESVKLYVSASEAAAQKHGTDFLDMNAAFAELMHHIKPSDLADDGVHPNTSGHLFIATRVYERLRELLGL